MVDETTHYGANRRPPPAPREPPPQERSPPEVERRRAPISTTRIAANLADRQFGVVTRSQLHEAGVTPSTVGHWLERGRLRPLHRGVYALGHTALRVEGRWLAAVLASGSGALLSHRSAAALWGVLPASPGPIEVTTPRARRSQNGIRTHRTRCPRPEDSALHRSIPVTCIERTLLDLAPSLGRDALEAAIAAATRRELTAEPALVDAMVRSPGHRGLGRMTRAIAREPKHTRSQLERRFLRLVRRSGLPEPETNAWITLGRGEEWQIDAVWPAQRVSAELDGWRFHRDRRSFERDRARVATMTAAGYRHVQFTWRQVVDDPGLVARTLAALLRPPMPPD